MGQNSVDQSNQIAGFFKMQHRKKEVNDEVYFWHVEKKVFCKLILSCWMCVVRHAQST